MKFGLLFCITLLLSGCSNNTVPLVAVLPHHNLVKQQRDNMLQQLSALSQPDTIILLSPNHFNAGDGDVLTTNRTWQLHNGDDQIYPNAELVEQLTAEQLINLDDAVFNNEHGIKNVLDDMFQYFPNAKIVPIIFKSTVQKTTVTKLVNDIHQRCPQCGVLASVDMSHYQPANVADIHDIKTIRALTNLDNNDIWSTEVDSTAALAFLVQWAALNQLKKFNLFAHTNSGFLGNDYQDETTTHIMGYYTAGDITPLKKEVTFTLLSHWPTGTEAEQRTTWGTDVISDITDGYRTQIGNITISISNINQKPEMRDNTLMLPYFRDGAITGVISENDIKLVPMPDTVAKQMCDGAVSCNNNTIEINY